MLFNSLLPILEKVNLSFTVSAKNGQISVTVLPKTLNKKGDTLSNTPLAISGTADELDESFVTDITEALSEAVNYTKNSKDFVEAVKEKSTSENKTTTEKKESTKTEKTEKTEKVVLTAAQKKLLPKAEEALKKAKAASDPDMVEFLKKQIVKLYEDAKMPDETTKELIKQFDTIEVKPSVSQTDIFTPANPDTEEDTTQEETSSEKDDNDDDDDGNDIKAEPDPENTTEDTDDIF